MNSDDKRLLEASASGQTDQVLQLIEEHGHQLHKFKDQVSRRRDVRTSPTNFTLKSFWQELKNIHHFPIKDDYFIMRKWFYPSPSLLATQQSRLLSFALSVLLRSLMHCLLLQDGRTALHLAAANGHSETVSALIMNGAEISAQDLVSSVSDNAQIRIICKVWCLTSKAWLFVPPVIKFRFEKPDLSLGVKSTWA